LKKNELLLAHSLFIARFLALKAIQEQQVIFEKQQQQIDLLLKRLEALEKNNFH
jgi:uncharacterized coiled-coil protein SlyX